MIPRPVSRRSSRQRPCHSRAFILFEILAASAVFAFALVSLVGALKEAIDSAIVVRNRIQMRLALEARLAEIRVKPFLAGDKDPEDADAYGVVFQESIQPLRIERGEGKEQLDRLWSMTVRATWEIDGEPQEDLAQIIIYR